MPVDEAMAEWRAAEAGTPAPAGPGEEPVRRPPARPPSRAAVPVPAPVRSRGRGVRLRRRRRRPPGAQVAAAGATADPVKDYLKQIGKVPLLNAEQEVELAKRIEAGLFAEEKLADGRAGCR